MANYLPTIGLEIHVQLATKSKMFCRCDNNAEGKEPNTVVCPVCMGFPGVLPVGNEQAIEWGVKTALALNCQINLFQRFDRKNYFYPDLPKGYQISQFFFPAGENGKIKIDYQPETGKEKQEFVVRIKRIHLEEDAGKLVHAKGSTLVDFNRCGTPLMEIVTEPDMHSSKEARAFIQELQRIVRALGVSMADMEKGHLRVDANISLAPEGSKELGTLVELKNMNSFKFVERALEYEVKRQTEELEKGERIIKSTRGWDEKSGTTLLQRIKEESTDYRYLPEPDLPPIVLEQKQISKWQKELPALPAEWRQIAQTKNLPYGRVVELQEAGNLERLVNLLEANNNLDAVMLANWLSKEWKSDDVLVDFVQTISQNNLSGSVANQLYEMAKAGDKPLRELLGGLKPASKDLIETTIKEIIQSNPKAVAEYRAGESKVLGFLVGQVMARLKGQGDAALISQTLIELLTK